MKPVLRKSVLSLAMAASLLGSATWSTASHACAAEAYVTSICVMSMRGSYAFDGYVLANGAQLAANQYAAVFSLLGNTYGGDGVRTFNLPDMRGRVVLGAGSYTDKSGSQIYQPGQTGGLMTNAGSVTLTAANLPPHAHTLSPSTATPANGVTVSTGIGSLKVAMAGLTATTTLGTLAASTSLTGVTASASASGLTLNASSNATLVNSPSGALLGTTTLPGSKIYSTGGPLVAMQAGSIAGTLPVTFAGSSPTTTLSGAPATTISGNPSLTGAPAVAVGGQTDVAGKGAPATAIVPTMMPYLAMNYYFSITGMYPVNNQ